MSEDKPKKHPNKSECVTNAADIGGEKPCMMDEVFDENFDLRPPPESGCAKKRDDRPGSRA
jgi:hypothetical protein